MQLKVLAGGVALTAAVGALCDRAIQGPPEMLVIWILATLGVAIEGLTLLTLLACRGEHVATATILPTRSHNRSGR